MFQEYQLRFTLAVILFTLCGSLQEQLDGTNISEGKSSNCDEPTPTVIVNYQEADIKLEKKLESLELKLDKMEERNYGLLQILVKNALPDLDWQLYNAAKNGETERVVFLITGGVNTDYTDYKGNRAIHVAAKHSHAKIIDVLLNNKADPNVHGQYDYTPIHWTSNNGCLSCAKILLTHGASVDSRDKWRDTPLIKAAKYGYTELVKLLLDKGADINATQKQKYTALHMASRDGRTKTADILVHRGADINMKTEDGETALDFAVENSNYEIIGLLKSKLKMQQQ